MGRGNRDTGRSGEKTAAAFLRRSGYKITGANVRTPFGELDLVAEQGGYTVFVEIKTRVTDSFGPPSLSITWIKQAHIIRNALWYLKRYGLIDTLWRIDIVSVKLDPLHRLEYIEVIENAVEGEGH
jgi:putative endonuclease